MAEIKIWSNSVRVSVDGKDEPPIGSPAWEAWSLQNEITYVKHGDGPTLVFRGRPRTSEEGEFGVG